MPTEVQRDLQLVPQTEAEANAKEEDEEVHTPLDEDTYGVALFSIVQDCGEIWGGGRDSDDRPLTMNAIRLFYCNAVLLMNYILQFGMLYFIKSYVVDPAIEENESKQTSSGPGSKSLLQMLLTDHPLFLGVVLILWTLTTLIEFRKVERFIRQVRSLPTKPTLLDMYNTDTDDDGNETLEIKGLTRGIYAIILIGIILPKILIVILLFWLGFKWLAATNAPADLILNALALEFVVSIDEQLFEALLPKCVTDKIGTVFLTTHKKPYKDATAELQATLKSEWGAYRRSMFYFAAPILISWSYIYYMQCEFHARAEGLTMQEYMFG